MLTLYVITFCQVMPSTLLLLRQVAPRLTEQLFPRICQSKSANASATRQRWRSRLSCMSGYQKGFTQYIKPVGGCRVYYSRLQYPFSLRRLLASSSGQGPASFFPEESTKHVGYWLLGSAASVFGIVVFGGLTRLTESGSVVLGIRKVHF